MSKYADQQERRILAIDWVGKPALIMPVEDMPNGYTKWRWFYGHGWCVGKLSLSPTNDKEIKVLHDYGLIEDNGIDADKVEKHFYTKLHPTDLRDKPYRPHPKEILVKPIRKG